MTELPHSTTTITRVQLWRSKVKSSIHSAVENHCFASGGKYRCVLVLFAPQNRVYRLLKLTTRMFKCFTTPRLFIVGGIKFNYFARCLIIFIIFAVNSFAVFYLFSFAYSWRHTFNDLFIRRVLSLFLWWYLRWMMCQRPQLIFKLERGNHKFFGQN